LKKANQILSWAAYIFIFIFLIIIGLEFGLRLYTTKIEKSLWKTAMMDHVQKRIDRIWNLGKEKKEIKWGPPYDVYWNEGLGDPARMKLIYQHSFHPKAGEWESPNFLRAKGESKDHSFKVKINSLGFRDQERSIEKPPKTKRIIVLGSYPAFGHGVNNKQTYSSQLELILQRSHADWNFEVWNGGMQGIVAIMGYARFLYELEKYDPDLIIFDFGWVDFFMRQDQTKTASDTPTWSKPHWNFFQKLAAKIRFSWFPNSSVSKVIDNYAKKSFRDLNKRQWKNVMRRTASLAQKRDIPILFVRQFRESVWPELYIEFTRPDENLHFIDTTKAFSDKAVTNKIVDKFWSKSNWLTELGKTKDTTPRTAENYFKADALQFNEFGHKAIAKLLAPKVSKILLP